MLQLQICVPLSPPVKNRLAESFAPLVMQYQLHESQLGGDQLLLFRWWAASSGSAGMEQLLDREARSLKPFMISLRDLLPLPSHSLMIQAAAGEQLLSLGKKLSKLLKPHVVHTRGQEPFRPPTFPLALFRNLKPRQFKKILVYLEHHPIGLLSEASKMALYMRPSENLSFSPVREFHFQGSRAITHQQQLF